MSTRSVGARQWVGNTLAQYLHQCKAISVYHGQNTNNLLCQRNVFPNRTYMMLRTIAEILRTNANHGVLSLSMITRFTSIIARSHDAVSFNVSRGYIGHNRGAFCKENRCWSLIGCHHVQTKDKSFNLGPSEGQLLKFGNYTLRYEINTLHQK
jgi:hypothetical protein